MSVTLMPSGKFQGYVTDASGKRYRKLFDTKGDAEDWEMESRLIIKRGNTPKTRSKSPNMTLKNAFDEAYKSVWRHGRSSKTNLTNAESIMKYFGHTRPVQSITTEEVECFKSNLESIRNSNSTINKKLSCLSIALKRAKTLGAIKELPTLERVPETSSRPRFVSEEDVDRLILRAEMLGFYDIAAGIIIASRTGIRQGELLSLHSTSKNWDHNFIDMESKEIVLLDSFTKNGKTHKAPMPKRVLPVVERLCKEAGEEKDLFKDLNKNILTYKFKKVCDIEGFRMRWHDFRHCFCSWHVQKGTPIEAVSRLANHSDISVTMRYAYLSNSNYHDYAKVLD